MAHKVSVICDFEVWGVICEEFILLQKFYFSVLRTLSTGGVHFCTF